MTRARTIAAYLSLIAWGGLIAIAVHMAGAL